VTPEQEGKYWINVVVVEDCWEWVGHSDRDGYGRWHVGGKYYLAHRFSYEQNVGPIPDGLTIDHLCRNRRCVKPSHLEPVTQRENVMRGASHVARNSTKTHCVHGHSEWTKRPNGERRCAACARARWGRKP